MNDIPDRDSLQAHVGPVSVMAEKKVLHRLDKHSRHFIELSPFLVIATSDKDGHLDVSPRGDPPGFVRVLDDTTLLLPDRPGNNRVDTLANILESPAVALVFFLPGVEETFRVNGTAHITTDPTLLAASEVNGRTPKTGLVITIDEAFFHCAKALKRSRLWDPEAQIERTQFPTLGRILADQQSVDAAEADARIQTGYRDRLY